MCTYVYGCVRCFLVKVSNGLFHYLRNVSCWRPFQLLDEPLFPVCPAMSSLGLSSQTRLGPRVCFPPSGHPFTPLPSSARAVGKFH